LIKYIRYLEVTDIKSDVNYRFIIAKLTRINVFDVLNTIMKRL